MKTPEGQSTLWLRLNKGDNTNSISPILSEDENSNMQKYNHKQKNKKVLQSFTSVKDSRMNYFKLNRRIYHKDEIYTPHHLDSSPSINSEWNEFSNNRQQISDNLFINLTKLNQNTHTQKYRRRAESGNYLNNLECQESKDLNEFESSIVDFKRNEKLRRKSRAIFPADIKRKQILEENKYEIMINSSVDRKNRLKNDMSDYNDSLMNEKLYNHTPLYKNSNTEFNLKHGLISENIPETPIISLSKLSNLNCRLWQKPKK